MLRSAVKRVTPSFIRQARRTFIVQRSQRRFGTMSPSEIFESVYAEGHWGSEGGDGFYSGLGSHDEQIVGPYVDAVTAFLETEASGAPLDVVDLGCGDFNVGAQIRPACGRYVACDVAPSLVERNRERYATLDVDFRVVDIVEDDLPAGDVVFVRQVLQHLGNAQILRVLPKLRAYRWAVVTEHLPPAGGDFVPNRDIPAGPRIRTDLHSGVVLHEPPFSLAAGDDRELCVVTHPTGTITTTAYRFDRP